MSSRSWRKAAVGNFRKSRVDLRGEFRESHMNKLMSPPFLGSLLFNIIALRMITTEPMVGLSIELERVGMWTQAHRPELILRVCAGIRAMTRRVSSTTPGGKQDLPSRCRIIVDYMLLKRVAGSRTWLLPQDIRQACPAFIVSLAPSWPVTAFFWHYRPIFLCMVDTS